MESNVVPSARHLETGDRGLHTSLQAQHLGSHRMQTARLMREGELW